MIYTTQTERGVNIPYPKSKKVITKDNMSFTIIFTAYMEAMFEDLQNVLESKIDESVKKKLRMLINRYDHSNSNWLSSDLTAQLHFNLCSQIEKHRVKSKKSILSKRESLNDLLMFLSYEFYVLIDRIEQIEVSASSPYKNVLKGVINSFNSYLNKKGYQDNLEIHKKRNEIQKMFLGCESDFAVEYKKVN
jgi:hypothetical protein